jgi:hypothetical protein
VAIAVANVGGLPARGQRPADIRDEQEAALIGEDEMGAEVCNFRPGKPSRIID